MGKGVIEILHTTKGHDVYQIPEDPAKAKEDVQGMIRKGHSLILEDGGTSHKVSDYDEKTNEYLVHQSATEVKETRHPADPKATRATSIDVGGVVKQVHSFDDKTNEYVVQDNVTSQKTLRFPAATAKVTAEAPVAGG